MAVKYLCVIYMFHCLKTADELAGQNNYHKIEASLIGLPEKYFPFKTVASDGLTFKNIDNQIEYLEYLIKDQSNWYKQTK